MSKELNAAPFSPFDEAIILLNCAIEWWGFVFAEDLLRAAKVGYRECKWRPLNIC